MKKTLLSLVVCLLLVGNCFAVWNGQRYQAAHGGKYLRTSKTYIAEILAARIKNAPIFVLIKIN